MQANILPFYTPLIPGWIQQVKTSLMKVMLHTKLQERSFEQCLSACTPKAFWVG